MDHLDQKSNLVQYYVLRRGDGYPFRSGKDSMFIFKSNLEKFMSQILNTSVISDQKLSIK